MANPKPTFVPWSFLIDSTVDPPKSKPVSNSNVPKQQKTFVEAVNNVCDIPMSQLPKAVVKGNMPAIEIPEEEYESGLDACKHNLHGRVIWPKGAQPLTVVSLKNKLSTLWKSIGRWGVTSIGKGYYEFVFSSVEDVRRVRAINSWDLNPGFLKLFTWTKDFNPSTLKQSSAQVWVKIHGLSQEYWRPKIIFAIASCMGTPLCTDAATNKNPFERHFGHYVRVMVDIDLTQELRYKVLVERKGYAFFVEMEYENLPDYCTFCKCTGHYYEICKRRVPNNQADKNEKNKNKPETRKEFVQVVDNRGKGKHVEVVDLEKSAGIAADVNLQTKDAGPSGVKDNVTSFNRYKELARMEDDILENEVNAEMLGNVEQNGENSDSNESEFVDATQVDEEEQLIENNEVTNKQIIAATTEVQANIQNNDIGPNVNDITKEIPMEVQKDMAFLHQSWANLAELEAIEALEIPDDENEELLEAGPNEAHMDLGFQMVKSKRRKRGGKQHTAPRSSYTTRAKSGKSNPFS